MQNNLEEKVKNQIESVKLEIEDITTKIEALRAEGDIDNDTINQELLGRLEILTEKVQTLKKNLLAYTNAKSKKEVSIGHSVEIASGNNKRLITLVLPEDADPVSNFISIESPIGQAILGKQKGDSVEVVTPNGNQRFSIQKLVQ